MKTSKVKSVQGNGSFKSGYGALQDNGDKLLFSFEYEFEDGIVLKANHKTNVTPFPEGSEVEYEITRESEQYGKSGKVSKPQSKGFNNSNKGGSDLKGIKIGHAITNAVQLLNGKQHPITGDLEEDIKRLARKILKIGEELNNENVKVNPKLEVPPDITPLIPETDDDLPF